MILALILMIPQGLQAFLVLAASGLDSDGRFWGIGAAFLYLIAGAFALAEPTVSLVVFLIAAFFSFVAATTDPSYSDAWMWLGVSLILAVMSYFARREKIRGRPAHARQQAEQVQAQAQALAQAMMQAQAAAAQGAPSINPES
jgi:hypothetical protein